MSDDEKQKLAVLEERVSNWMETTTEYRKTLCSKIDCIMTRLDKLPCDKRDGWYKSMSRQVAFMWILISAVVLGLLKELFAK